MVEPVTELVLEAPAGLVRVARRVPRRRAASGSRSRTCRRSPPTSTRRSRSRASASCAVDVAYGGAFCAFVDADALGFAIVPGEARELAELGERIRPAVAEQLEIAHPAEPALGALSFVVFVAPPRVGGDARHATIVSPGRLDRSPTGTATSARIAVLAARGLMGDGEDVRQRERDRHALRRPDRAAARTVGGVDAIVPAITGRAWITGSHQLVVDPDDPFPEGFKLPDTWGAGLDDEAARRSRAPTSSAALDLDALVDELAAAFAALSAGEASMPPRTGVEVPGAGTILLMGAHRRASPSVTVKLVSLFPGHDPPTRRRSSSSTPPPARRPR